jgi:hypothetical protein
MGCMCHDANAGTPFPFIEKKLGPVHSFCVCNGKSKHAVFNHIRIGFT